MHSWTIWPYWRDLQIFWIQKDMDRHETRVPKVWTLIFDMDLFGGKKVPWAEYQEPAAPSSLHGGPFPKIMLRYDNNPCKSRYMGSISENHTHVRVRGSNGPIEPQWLQTVHLHPDPNQMIDLRCTMQTEKQGLVVKDAPGP